MGSYAQMDRTHSMNDVRSWQISSTKHRRIKRLKLSANYSHNLHVSMRNHGDLISPMKLVLIG